LRSGALPVDSGGERTLPIVAFKSDLAHAGSIVVATSVTEAHPLAPPKAVGDLTEFESLWIQEGRYGVIRRLVP